MTNVRVSGDRALLGIIASDFFGALAGATVHLTLIWWVLERVPSPEVVSLMILAIFVPINVGVLFSGYAVARMGARRLLLISKGIAFCGAFTCFLLLASGQMTLWTLALIAIVTYGAMGPSLTADLARVPALARLAKRRLVGFHATNNIAMLAGQIGGFVLSGYLMDFIGMPLTVLTGCGLVLVSLGITWASFPRDRNGQAPEGSVLSVTRDLAVTVFKRVAATPGMLFALGLVGLIVAMSEGISEVYLPLVIRENGLPASTLSSTLIGLVIASVFGAIIAPFVSGRVALRPLVAGSAILVVGLIVLSVWVDSWIVVAGLIALIVGVATLADTLAVAEFQESMPNSLQAQAMGLWESAVLAASALAIVITGALS